MKKLIILTIILIILQLLDAYTTYRFLKLGLAEGNKLMIPIINKSWTLTILIKVGFATILGTSMMYGLAKEIPRIKRFGYPTLLTICIFYALVVLFNTSAIIRFS